MMLPSPLRRRLLAVLPAAGACGLAIPSAGAALDASARSAVDAAVAASRGAEADADALAAHVLNRLGYGPRPGDLQAVRASGIDAWIEAQLRPASLPLPESLEQALARLRSIDEPHPPALAAYAALQRDALSAEVGDEQRARARRDLAALVQRVQGEARQARLLRAVHSPRQLEEVLVEFWFNHFNVFAGKETIRVTVAHFEREAIRPHVLGRFRDMLGATARHPAMLNYLDNASSVVDGFRPSPAVAAALPPGARPPSGLNENYARELLELHTLGVDGGYSQHDVRELARVFTGWTFDRRAGSAPHSFRFVAARHDFGAKRLLGTTVPVAGRAEGEWALDLLARHPSTARHVARKLARWFVADRPPPSLVDRLAARFTATDGDLRETVRALAFSPEFRDPRHFTAKFKTPYQYVISAVRATGLPLDDARPLAAVLARMGMPVYGCPTPDGWRDAREAWASPDALVRRVEFAAGIAGRTGAARAPAADPANDPAAEGDHQVVTAETVLATLGPTLRPATRALVAASEPMRGLALALASPDFMQR